MAEERQAIPSQQSADELLGLRPVATADASRAIKSWPERIKEQAIFSARTTSRAYLDLIRNRLADIAARNVIPSVAEASLRKSLEDIGYSPQTGFPDDRGRVPPATPGSIRDLSSSRRIQLIIDTNVKQARSMGQMASSENPVFLMANPAWKLTRTGARKKPRGDWRVRWTAAGNAVGWKGASKTQMVALKTSPIWTAIGSGAGGFDDTLASAFPPFAFGSGMAWVNVGRREWKRICAQEGIADGLTEVAELAKSAKTAQEALYGAGRFGANIPSSEGEKPRTGGFRRLPESRSGVAIAFDPKILAKTRAIDQIDATAADASATEAEVRQALVRLKKAKGVADALDDDSRDEIVAAIGKYEKELAAVQKDLKKLSGNMETYRQKAASVPPPANERGQFAFDNQMGRVEEAARATRQRIESLRQSVAAKVKAAEDMSVGKIEVTHD